MTTEPVTDPRLTDFMRSVASFFEVMNESTHTLNQSFIRSIGLLETRILALEARNRSVLVKLEQLERRLNRLSKPPLDG